MTFQDDTAIISRFIVETKTTTEGNVLVFLQDTTDRMYKKYGWFDDYSKFYYIIVRRPNWFERWLGISYDDKIKKAFNRCMREVDRLQQAEENRVKFCLESELLLKKYKRFIEAKKELERQYLG
jgi:hypothetical protein